MSSVRPRGRPRQFDPIEAMAAMRDVFWRFGFEATSLDMLCAAASMSRPSLYAAFGDKRTIYRALMQAFTKQAESELACALDDASALGEALATFYGRAIELYAKDNGGLGCPAICTLTPLAADDAELRDLLSTVLCDMDDLLERRIERAVRDGDVCENAPVPALSATCSAILQSLSIRARAGADVNELKQFVASAVQVLTPWMQADP